MPRRDAGRDGRVHQEGVRTRRQRNEGHWWRTGRRIMRLCSFGLHIYGLYDDNATKGRSVGQVKHHRYRPAWACVWTRVWTCV